MRHIKLFENFNKMTPQDIADDFMAQYDEPTAENVARYIIDNRDKIYGDPEISVMDWYGMPITDQFMEILGVDKDYVSAAYEELEAEGPMPKGRDMRKIVGE